MELDDLYLKKTRMPPLNIALQKSEFPLCFVDMVGDLCEVSSISMPDQGFEVQVKVINYFAPRYVPGGRVLYLGDTANKDLYRNDVILKEIGIPISEHSKLPDIVIYDEAKQWLFLIEVVTSHGPVSPERMLELGEFLKDCRVGKVYVTAFPDMAEFKKIVADIAWETEVWIADTPDHIIHYNGDRFIGPRKSLTDD